MKGGCEKIAALPNPDRMKKSILRSGLIPLLLLLWSTASAAGEIRAEFDMDHDPEIHVPERIKALSERQKALWQEALARPEADMQRMAADAIGRAHAGGFPDMTAYVSGLVAVLTAPASHPAARLAVARTLVTLDAKEIAPQMAACAEKYGADLRQIAEPALAGWNYQPYRAVWHRRLTGNGVRRRDLILAIRCLTTAKDNSRVSLLLDLVHDRLRPPDVRLEAAQAAGFLQDSGLESDARRLMAGSQVIPLVNRLCAARLIARHCGADGQTLLAELAIDQEPAVAAMGLRRLIEIDPQLASPQAESALQSADAKVRQCGVDTCVLVPDPQRVAGVARLLDDPHPAVRASVRDSLYDLAQRRPELDEPIRKAAAGMLAADRWRGLEQAALLLAALDHKPAAGRLLELLEYGRPEVFITAAWALKKLAVPETLPAILDKARRQSAARRTGTPDPASLDRQTAHLFEALGRMKYAPAEPLLREYIPKDMMWVLSRSSAIWSLGLLHEGVPDEPLAVQLMERIADDGGPLNPVEFGPVKLAGAVSIARMKAASQVPALRKRITPAITPDRMGMTIRWAVMELTGERIPAPAPATSGKLPWFLEPLEPPGESSPQ
jgi:hypothetical protein